MYLLLGVIKLRILWCDVKATCLYLEQTHACMYTFCNIVSLRLGGMYTDVRFCFLKMPETCLKKIIRPILGSINLHPKNRILKISILHKMFKTGSHNPANESCTS